MERGASTISGRYATLAGIDDSSGAQSVSYTEGESFDTVALGAGATPVEFNSILLVPDLLTAEERAALITDVEAHRAQHAGCHDGGRERYMTRELGEATQRTFERALRDRLLPLISAELPAVVELLWARSLKTQRDTALCDCPLVFSAQEPAINRYSAGGRFEPHVDKLALTMNVLLAEGAFGGGGTQFWREGDAADAADAAREGGEPAVDREVAHGAPTLRLEPGAGVGVV